MFIQIFVICFKRVIFWVGVWKIWTFYSFVVTSGSNCVRRSKMATSRKNHVTSRKIVTSRSKFHRKHRAFDDETCRNWRKNSSFQKICSVPIKIIFNLIPGLVVGICKESFLKVISANKSLRSLSLRKWVFSKMRRFKNVSFRKWVTSISITSKIG